jgi:predicted site-specific integrase-resolvase
MDYLTIKEISAKWGVGTRIVTQYCNEGRIKGAEKKGDLWLIPKDAPKPPDKRRRENKSSGRY